MSCLISYSLCISKNGDNTCKSKQLNHEHKRVGLGGKPKIPRSKFMSDLWIITSTTLPTWFSQEGTNLIPKNPFNLYIISSIYWLFIFIPSFLGDIFLARSYNLYVRAIVRLDNLSFVPLFLIEITIWKIHSWFWHK